MPGKKARRRDVLKSVGAGAFISPVVTAVAEGETVKLPRFRSADGVEVWMERPKKWWRHVQNVKRQNRKIVQTFGDRDGVLEVSSVRAPERYGDKYGLQVKIGVDKSRLTVELPDQSNDVPIKTVETEPPEELCWNESYSDLKGGQMIGNPQDDTAGTTGWKVSKNNNDYILTANHTFSSGSHCNDTSGSVVAGDKNFDGTFNQVGTIHETLADHDVAVIDPDRNTEPYISGENQDYFVDGWGTEQGLSDMATDPWDGYRKMGLATGETTGGIKEIHVTDAYEVDCANYDGHGVKGGASAAQGDSGGPAFKPRDDGNWLLYIVTHSKPESTGIKACNGKDIQPETQGTATYYLNDNEGYKVASW